MRFLIDECAGPAVARWLQSQGHEVYSVYDSSPGVDDEIILKKLYSENRILITLDKDFGEKIYRDNCLHHGVILLRLEDERPANAIAVLRHALRQLGPTIEDHFVVVTETKIRIAR